MESVSYLLVNFGGPRALSEVEEFLVELLCDQEVVRTSFPKWIHKLLFTRIAKKRAVPVSEDYGLIGGKSPIFEDTEKLAKGVKDRSGAEVITFHRYLPETHNRFITQVSALQNEIRVVPLFPQFSDATTGSIAKWFIEHLPQEVVAKMRWLKSYPTHPGYVRAMQNRLRSFLDQKGWKEEEVFLLFSAHGVPRSFVNSGDPYQKECESTYQAVKEAFPKAITLLSYQSQFGKQPWIVPYTSTVVIEVNRHCKGRKKAVVVPLSFTSDHIETLFEVEEQYLPPLRERGLEAERCPALNLGEEWQDVLSSLFEFEGEGSSTAEVYRNKALSK